MRVILLGANGMFGKRLALLLAAMADLDLVLAGRKTAELRTLANRLQTGAGTRIEVLAVDLDHADSEVVIAAVQPEVLIDTCGPFQRRDYRLARLAIARGFHYFDLADAPGFVAGIGVLDAAARAADVLVCSGASTVPALTAAVIDHYRSAFSELRDIDIGISPGNQAERGAATVRSILSAVGKPHAQFEHGSVRLRPGWSGLRRHRYLAPVGQRWLARCAAPDALLLPMRYPGLRSLEFRAGLELWRMHFGTWLGGVLVRVGVLRSLAPYADWARRLSERWIGAGSDCGAMHVCLRGIDAHGAPLRIEWQLIAEHGDGPLVPAAAAASLVTRLAAQRLPQRGAMACVGVLTLQDFQQTLASHAIRFECKNSP